MKVCKIEHVFLLEQIGKQEFQNIGFRNVCCAEIILAFLFLPRCFLVFRIAFSFTGFDETDFDTVGKPEPIDHGLKDLCQEQYKLEVLSSDLYCKVLRS